MRKKIIHFNCFHVYAKIIYRLRMAEKTGHKFIERGAHKGKGIAVFTSGGDSQVSSMIGLLFVLKL